MGKAERLSNFPLFPLEIADDPQLVRIALAAGDRELAEQATHLADRRCNLNPEVRSLEAVAAHARGLCPNSIDDLAAAVSLYQDCPRPLALASALEDLGRSQVTAGATAEGIAALDRALEITVRTGAGWDAARVRRRLRVLGVRRRVASSDRPRVGWEALTSTELRIATLVSDGKTNREIGEKLFISPHTVNSHLRNIFGKVGIDSRVELARLAGTRAS